MSNENVVVEKTEADREFEEFNNLTDREKFDQREAAAPQERDAEVWACPGCDGIHEHNACNEIQEVQEKLTLKFFLGREIEALRESIKKDFLIKFEQEKTLLKENIIKDYLEKLENGYFPRSYFDNYDEDTFDGIIYFEDEAVTEL